MVTYNLSMCARSEPVSSKPTNRSPYIYMQKYIRRIHIIRRFPKTHRGVYINKCSEKRTFFKKIKMKGGCICYSYL